MPKVCLSCATQCRTAASQAAVSVAGPQIHASAANSLRLEFTPDVYASGLHWLFTSAGPTGLSSPVVYFIGSREGCKSQGAEVGYLCSRLFSQVL